MLVDGKLRSWNEDRGFGFITPALGGADVFVHVSAFPRDGKPPTVGEKLSYQTGEGRDGRPRAVAVVRQAGGSLAPKHAARRAPPKYRSNWLGGLAVVVLLVAGGLASVKQVSAWQHRRELASQSTEPSERSQPALRIPSASETPATYSCDGRTYCSQMTSCAEAKWFINNCPGTKMDGNQDGVPCQEQWCN